MAARLFAPVKSEPVRQPITVYHVVNKPVDYDAKRKAMNAVLAQEAPQDLVERLRARGCL
jgi:hypothetical protein